MGGCANFAVRPSHDYRTALLVTEDGVDEVNSMMGAINPTNRIRAKYEWTISWISMLLIHVLGVIRRKENPVPHEIPVLLCRDFWFLGGVYHVTDAVCTGHFRLPCKEFCISRKARCILYDYAGAF